MFELRIKRKQVFVNYVITCISDLQEGLRIGLASGVSLDLIELVLHGPK